MFRRILLNPDAAGGGGVTTPPTEKPVETPAATPTPVDTAPSEVRFRAEAWEAVQAQLAELKAMKDAEAQRKADADRARQEALVKDGKHGEALRELNDRLAAQDAKLAEKEAAYRRGTLDRELTQALAARTDLAPGAVAKILKDIREDFEVADEAGQYHVRSAGGRQTPADYITAYLAKPDNRLFLKAGGGSGAGASGTNLSGAAQDAATAAKLAAIEANPVAKDLWTFYQKQEDVKTKGWLPQLRPTAKR